MIVSSSPDTEVKKEQRAGRGLNVDVLSTEERAERGHISRTRPESQLKG